jgi:hypothetical protein
MCVCLKQLQNYLIKKAKKVKNKINDLLQKHITNNATKNVNFKEGFSISNIFCVVAYEDYDAYF